MGWRPGVLEMETLTAQIAQLQANQQALVGQLTESRRETQAALQQIHEARRSEEQANADRRMAMELAMRVAARSGGTDIVDGKGVGQPPKFSGKEETDFQERAHKMQVFITAKFGAEFQPVMKWAATQRKRVTQRKRIMGHMGDPVPPVPLAERTPAPHDAPAPVPPTSTMGMTFCARPGRGRGAPRSRRMHAALTRRGGSFNV